MQHFEYAFDAIFWSRHSTKKTAIQHFEYAFDDSILFSHLLWAIFLEQALAQWDFRVGVDSVMALRNAVLADKEAGMLEYKTVGGGGLLNTFHGLRTVYFGEGSPFLDLQGGGKYIQTVCEWFGVI